MKFDGRILEVMNRRYGGGGFSQYEDGTVELRFNDESKRVTLEQLMSEIEEVMTEINGE